MSREAVQELLDRWMNEPGFRAQMRTNADTTVQNAGLVLEEDERAALQSVDWSLPDEELQTRISKCG